jgi:Rieske Fe-S protein
LAELQKDPVTRGEFLGMGVMGALIGAVLTIPPLVYILDPSIRSEGQGQSDIPDEWRQLGSVFEVPANEPKTFRVEFPQTQTYDERKETGTLTEAVLVSWRDGMLPDVLQNRGRGRLSQAEIEDLTQRINVLSNHCAHLGCPTRWHSDNREIACPCHGGIYDINGDYLAGPPPRGLYRYAFQIREDGGLYVKHEFDGKPWVV